MDTDVKLMTDEDLTEEWFKLRVAQDKYVIQIFWGEEEAPPNVQRMWDIEAELEHRVYFRLVDAIYSGTRSPSSPASMPV